MPYRDIIHLELAALRKQLYAAIAVVAVVVLAVGWTSDLRSCLRQQPIRESLRDGAQVDLKAAQYWDARGQHAVAARARRRAAIADQVPKLGCYRILPEA